MKVLKLFRIFGATLGWIAIMLQFYLILHNRVASVSETIIRFFSFYTILTNILVAVCFTYLLTGTSSRLSQFFAHPKTTTAIAVYIGIVGGVYNLVLRHLWAPTGLQLLVDELLHSVIPLFFLIYWFVFVPKEGIEFKNIFSWLIYPITYLIYILIRGWFSGFYPYPFIDASALGYFRVILNSTILVVIFLIFSVLLLLVAKKLIHSGSGRIN